MGGRAGGRCNHEVSSVAAIMLMIVVGAVMKDAHVVKFSQLLTYKAISATASTGWTDGRTDH